MKTQIKKNNVVYSEVTGTTTSFGTSSKPILTTQNIFCPPRHNPFLLVRIFYYFNIAFSL